MPTPPLAGWARMGSVALLLCTAGAWAADADPALPPDQAVALALTVHPDVRAAQAAHDTARASRTAALLGNPQASAWATPDGSRADLSLTQPISLTGEGWHTRGAARWSTEATDRSLDRARRLVAADVRAAYADAAVAVGLVAVALEGADLAGRLRFGVSRKHDEGEASTLDLRLARLAEVQAATRLLQARRTESESLRALADRVGLPVRAPDLLEDPLAAAPEGSVDENPDRSDVSAAEAALDAARAQLRQARASILPPVQIGVGLELDQGTTAIGPSLGLTLPLFDRAPVARKTALGQVSIAEAQLSTLRARVATEQQTSAQRVQEAEQAAQTVELSEQDEARAALASIEAGVLAGEIDLATAVLLQTQVLDGEAAVVQLRGLVARARIDRLLALDDDALLRGAQ